jgi:hypothetical protein
MEIAENGYFFLLLLFLQYSDAKNHQFCWWFLDFISEIQFKIVTIF